MWPRYIKMLTWLPGEQSVFLFLLDKGAASGLSEKSCNMLAHSLFFIIWIQ